MKFPWQKMTVAEYAEYQGQLGEKVVHVGDTWWRRVRPFFYRPLLPYQEIDRERLKVPFGARLGGCQFSVPRGEGANSFLNLLMFSNLHEYRIETLARNKRRQIKAADRELSVRAILDPEEFKRAAYPVYLSFFERSRYSFKADRCHRPNFDRWVDVLFSFPKLLILGGYRNGMLGGVGISQRVEDILIYSTFFCTTEFRELRVADLLLHQMRTALVDSKGVKQMFVGMHKGERGLSDFYLQRGCELVCKPALLRVNPLTKEVLRRCLPRGFRSLCGEVDSPRETGGHVEGHREEKGEAGEGRNGKMVPYPATRLADLRELGGGAVKTGE